MNSAELYGEISGKAERQRTFNDLAATNKLVEPPAQDVARAQLKISWLQATITKEMFADIAREIQNLEDQSMATACSMHQVTPGVDKPLQMLLIQHSIAILRQLINKHAHS